MDRGFAVTLALASSAFASACMGIGKPAQTVRFAGQTNIVIWDAERGIEHFVRDARFETRGKSLGFIAPTPTRPSIEAASPAAFTTLAFLGMPGGGGGLGGLGGAGGVSVVERKIVAGYEATVIKADDARALSAWLSVNGFPMPWYGANWLSRYVRAGWYVTAFKVAAGQGLGSTGPVRMSFGTGTPFNPYSVPAQNRGPGELSLYFVSKGEEVPRIGGTEPWIEPRWRAKLDDRTASELETELALTRSAIPRSSSVRFFRDADFGRPGLDDLYFVPQPQSLQPASARGNPSSATLCMGLGLFAFLRVGRRPC